MLSTSASLGFFLGERVFAFETVEDEFSFALLLMEELFFVPLVGDFAFFLLSESAVLDAAFVVFFLFVVIELSSFKNYFQQELLHSEEIRLPSLLHPRVLAPNANFVGNEPLVHDEP